jgi:hypothetical protein
MKPNKSLAGDGAGRFRTAHRSVVLLSARTQVPGSRMVADPHVVDEEIHILCEALIASEGHLTS